MNLNFAAKREALARQFDDIQWQTDSGSSPQDLEAQVQLWEQTGLPHATIKAKTFALICEQGQIAIDRDDIFQDKLNGGKLMVEQRKRWEKQVKDTYLKEQTDAIRRAWRDCGAYTGHGDYGHISPNSKLLLEMGLVGLLERVERYAAQENLSESQHVFYDSCKIMLNAMITVAKRLSEAIRPYNRENADALWQIAVGKPRNTYEAMQLLILYFFLHEYVAGARVRTLGRLDVLLYPFYKKDLESGSYTKAEIREMLKFFLHKFWSAKVPFDLPFCLGGIDESGNEVTNEMSYLIVQTYNSLNIYSPKIHIRVSDQTSADFVKLVLSCIRGGNSSFVFVNDSIATKALRGVGITETDARNYVPIGCYEPAVWGVELGCTGNGAINLVKAVEFVFTRGRDLKSGEMIGIDTGEIGSYEAFIDALKRQLCYITDRAAQYVIDIEKHYREIYPDPILSCQYDESVRRGVDLYEGGAKYNSSSLYFYCIGSFVDAVCAVKQLVFEEKRLSFDTLGDILKKDWANAETLRQVALHLPVKYGNGNPVADAIAAEIADFCAGLVNNRPNGRGGVFKASLFTIDRCFYVGERTMATPDGRHAGAPLSKNMCATTGMDKNGVTALISSVTKMDLSKFPNGSVLDIILHPSAVQGEDGLDAFYALLLTYFRQGGFAMHGNVFHVKDLRAAQKEPEKYKTLQVRVCGWNAYFVELSKVEQDAFIRQAENAI
ncbi:MAG: hypothetical protein E7585_08145 [Ruminococcaceae bacterium]|nr:hypothetical protein [Oscillospiraceae bacterium]